MTNREPKSNITLKEWLELMQWYETYIKGTDMRGEEE